MYSSQSTRNCLQIGQKVGSCDVVQFLGAGGFGRVFRLVNTVSKFVFACKVVDLTVLRTVEIEAAKSEVNIHKQLLHVNVIRFYEAKRQNNLVLIGMELASTCLMDEVRKGLSAALCHRYFRELISGVEYLHSLCVAHRDIKTENLLIGRDGRLKIADFGLAIRFQRGKMVEGMCGTLQYMAPEVHTGLYHPEPADIWSCGVVLIEMLTQQRPWPSTVLHPAGLTSKPDCCCKEYWIMTPIAGTRSSSSGLIYGSMKGDSS